ncbi:hypothetical protein BC834DRAFT_208493 [Gloeopeniophorella convolvens]|nr:hypothetical protein BC834DRAFT_208493 [Gloeopeniophorella convolvens]
METPNASSENDGGSGTFQFSLPEPLLHGPPPSAPPMPILGEVIQGYTVPLQQHGGPVTPAAPMPQASFVHVYAVPQLPPPSMQPIAGPSAPQLPQEPIATLPPRRGRGTRPRTVIEPTHPCCMGVKRESLKRHFTTLEHRTLAGLDPDAAICPVCHKGCVLL